MNGLLDNKHGEDTLVSLRALLVSDRRFVEGEATVYTEGPTGPETGERYLEWFDTVTVAGQRSVVASQNVKRLNQVNAVGLNVVYLPDISSVQRRLRSVARARRELLALFEQVDAVIARLPTGLGREAAALALARPSSGRGP